MKVGELIDVLLEYHEDLRVYVVDAGPDHHDEVELKIKDIRVYDGKVVFG